MSKKRRKRKLKVGNLLILLFIVFLLIAGFAFMHYNNAIKAVQKENEEVTFTIESGQSMNTILTNLKNADLIKDVKMSQLYIRLNKLSNVKAGEYLVDKSWNNEKLFTYLNDPTTAITHDSSVTIVEGDWAKDIAIKISSVTNVSADELIALWNNQDYIRSLMGTYPFLTEEMFNSDVRIYLEGYLAPNTYSFFEETTAEDVTKKILDQTLAIYYEYQGAISTSGYSIHQIFTLASIVQYESGNVADMKAIAQVFYNRLNINMALQSSVTVCYAIDVDKSSDDWRKCEINSDFDSPYNTYKYPGLPPGPIVNPGKDAIDAVLNPDTSHSDDYYFMADVCGQGTVHYASNLDEHNANVNKYLSESGCLN